MLKMFRLGMGRGYRTTGRLGDVLRRPDRGVDRPGVDVQSAG